MPIRAEEIIALRQVAFGYRPDEPVLVVDELTVHRGERVFLRGASGSGKTTLLGLIAGVLEPLRGELRVLGTALPALSGSARDRFRATHLGFIFQMFNLIPYLSVLENVLLPLRFSKARRQRLTASGRSAVAEGRRLLDRLGLGDPSLHRRAVTELSQGQQQRVAAARALIGRPELVVADEPTSSLDADARGAFLELLAEECTASGATLLFVSHDASLAQVFGRTVDMGALNRAEGVGS